ncbi:MAG: FecR domain-containing protein [Pedobacter sp.]|uniref:FecR family protein n=1 Tax=Pedobacter sp. TaxID=1411316 RepID=UPI003562E6F5
MPKHQKQKYLAQIAKKVLNKSSSTIEHKFLNEYYDSFDKIPDVSDSLSKEEQLYLKQEIKMVINTKLSVDKRSKYRKLYVWMVSAAAIIIIGSISFYSFFYTDQVSPGDSEFVLNDINAGGNKAILTLSDGTNVLLDTVKSGIISGQPDIKITKSSDGQLVYTYTAASKHNSISANDLYNTISTPKGGQYQILLPDGTKVWLNASSSLRFPIRFANNERSVSLFGEGYFEVVHDKKNPFVVKTINQMVKVLGTHFNINSYNDEQFVKTTLLEGAVQVSQLSDNGQSELLRPGEQAISNDKDIFVKSADIESVVAWKNGDFVLRNEDFKATMRKIARWYDIEVVYSADAPEDLELGGWVSRNKNLSAVLKLMELTGKVHFKIEGRRVTVTK